MRLEIDEKNAKALVTELWQKITTTGFGSQSKNDFYDYVLYLFDKHDKNRFLLNASVYDNSQLLKVTNQKIKNTIENINLKYRGEDDKTEIPMHFLKSIANQKITQEEDTKEKKYTIVLENKSVRAYLDDILKKEQGTTFDCQLNDEKITLKIENFYALCHKVIQDLCESNRAKDSKTIIDIQEIKKEINKQELDAAKKEVVNALCSGAGEFELLKNIHVKEIAGIAKSAYAYIKIKLEHKKKE